MKSFITPPSPLTLRGERNEPMKKITIVTPTFNEEENVPALIEEVRKVFSELPNFEFEHIFIDNASTDKTVEILKEYASKDPRVKIIVNARNFGQSHSPHYALLQSSGDAATVLVADLQDPPALLKDFIKKWEEGYKMVIGIKSKSEENPVMFVMRKIYYSLLRKFAEIDLIKNFNGYGLYDKELVAVLRKFDDPDPFFRGMISEAGFARAEIEYTQAKRRKGKTKSNFYKLYDTAMLGFVSHSKMPLRLASFIGFGGSLLSFLIALTYLVRKILEWESFELGLAPLVVGIFFFGSIQLFFVGVIGEYVGAIYTQVKNRPLVIEKERINF